MHVHDSYYNIDLQTAEYLEKSIPRLVKKYIYPSISFLFCNRLITRCSPKMGKEESSLDVSFLDTPMLCSIVMGLSLS